MRVSRNEMNAALKRAYEGAGYDIGDYEDAAEQITWAEMSGFNVFSGLNIPPCAPKGSSMPQLVFESKSIAVVDAGGAQACQYGALAAHLAYSKAIKEGLTTVQLANCSMPIMLLRSLSLIAQRGVYLSVYWGDHMGEHGASFERGAIFPNYWCIAHNEGTTDVSASDITILCTPKAALLADSIMRQAEDPMLSITSYSAIRLANNYEQDLQQGIEVDPAQWEELNNAAWPILVQASEHSRGGAGPG